MRKALFVGIDEYPNHELTGCVSDAYALARIMEDNEDGSPNFSIVRKKNLTTKSELKGAISELFSGHSDVALFYFSGHGVLDSVGGYLVTPDYAPHDYGVSMSEILQLANDSHAKDRIIILDCCNSGQFGIPTGGGSSNCSLAEGVTVLTACRTEESAIEIDGHGVFTRLLLDAVLGGAADISGSITPGSVYSYIDQALGPWDQRPVFKTNVSSFLKLRTVKPSVPIELIRKLTTYFPQENYQFPLNPSFEFTNDPDVEHEYLEPYALKENVTIFKDLQCYEGASLVKPVDEEHMYFAAMHSKTCQLTSLGKHYWHLVNKRRI